jgi:hypothetical protein
MRNSHLHLHPHFSSAAPSAAAECVCVALCVCCDYGNGIWHMPGLFYVATATMDFEMKKKIKKK